MEPCFGYALPHDISFTTLTNEASVIIKVEKYTRYERSKKTVSLLIPKLTEKTSTIPGSAANSVLEDEDERQTQTAPFLPFILRLLSFIRRTTNWLARCLLETVELYRIFVSFYAEHNADYLHLRRIHSLTT